MTLICRSNIRHLLLDDGWCPSYVEASEGISEPGGGTEKAFRLRSSEMRRECQRIRETPRGYDSPGWTASVRLPSPAYCSITLISDCSEGAFSASICSLSYQGFSLPHS